MSTTVDNRVLEMRFDNKQFESGVATTMSTLDKLKKKLNLSGASKGLENVGKATKGINFSGMTASISQVKSGMVSLNGISAGVIAKFTVINNLCNSLFHTGKQMVSALTIDPVKTGFQEYETQIGAIQTILSNTRQEGTNVEIVNRALDELNTYADKTIYNFTEMTKNIGTFTAAGVKLDTSVNAIKGIANLAAVSGSTSQQASSAMYQLSQALAAGKVSLMDWNSVVNAGMGGKVFQDALIRTSELLGTGAEQAIQTAGSFRESLTKSGWLTTEVLTETLNQLSGAYSKADLMSQGFTESQANEIMALAKDAEDAATKVKTFTQLVDTVKESLQSGWGQTWRILVGDFEESKELFTEISDIIGKLVESSAKSRNELLTGVMTSNWNKLVSKINEAGIETGIFEEKVKSVAENHGYDIDDIIQKYGSLEKAFQSGTISSSILKEAINGLNTELIDLSNIEVGLSKGKTGEDVTKIQNALQNLNYDIGDSGADGIFGSATEAAVKAFQEVNNLKVTGIIDDATLDALNEANKSTHNLIGNVDDLIDGISELGGRKKIIDSFKNVFKFLGDVIEPVKEAFKEIFPPVTVEQLSEAINNFKSFTETLKISEDAASKVKSTFKGVFSAIDIGIEIFKALGKGALDIAGNFDGLGGNILDTASSFGEFISSIRDSIIEGDLLGKSVDKISDFLGEGISKIAEYGDSIINSFKISPTLQGFFGFFSGLWNVVKTVGSAIGITLSDIDNTIADIFGNGDISEVLNNGLFASILLYIRKFVKNLSKSVKDVSLLEGVKNTLDGIQGCLEAWQSNLKAGTLLKIASAIGILAASLFVISGIDESKLGSSLAAIGGLFAELISALAILEKINSGSIKPLSSIVSSLSGIARTVQMIGLGAAILILTTAMKNISDLDWNSVAKGLTGIGGIVTILVAAAKLMSTESKSITKFAGQILILSAAVAALSGVAKNISSTSWNELAKGGIAILGIVTILTGAAKLMSTESKSITKFAGQMLILSAAVGILAAIGNSLGSMSWNELAKGGAGILGIITMFITASKIMSKGSGSVVKFGGQMLLMASALAILTPVLKSLGSMSWENIGKGLIVIGVALVELSVGLKAMGGCLAGASALFIVATGLAILTPVLKSLGSMSISSIVKSLLVLAGAFAVIGISGALLSPLVPALLALSAAMGVFAVAIAGIGVGIFALSAGFTMLATAGAAGATAFIAALTVIITGVLGLIPEIAEVIGRGIVEIAKIIGDYAPQLAESFLKLLLGVLDALEQYAPQIVDSLLSFIIGVINSLATHTPELISVVMNFVGQVAKGVVDAIGSLDMNTMLKGIGAFGVIGLLMHVFAGAGALAGAAMVGVLAVGAVIAEIAVLLSAVGKLSEYLPEGGIEKAGDLLASIGNALGRGIGSFVGGIGEGVTGSLPIMGENIADFMAKLTTASENASGIKSGSFNGVFELMSVMVDIGKTTVGTTFSDIFTLGGTSMEKFETDGVAFFKAMSTISEASSGVTFDKASVSAVIDIATQLSTLQSSLENMGGVIDWFTGKDDLGTFGTSVASFMSSMKTAFSDTGAIAIDPVSLESTIDAASKLSTLQSSLENMGGVIDWFTGKDDLGTFGEKIGQFATAMSKLKAGMGENGISESVVTSVTNAGSALIALQEALPEEGWFDGKINLDTFSEYINKFATSMSTFSTTAIGIKPDSVDIAISTAYRIKDLIDALTDIEISGANIFSGVGAGDGPLVNIGQAIGKFGQAVSEIDTGKVSTAVSTAYRIKALVSELSEFDSSGISKFNIQDLAISIRDYALTVASVDYGSIDSSISVMNRLKSFVNSLSGFNASGISSFQNALSSLAQTNISGVADAFNSSSSQLSGIGTNMISSLSKGFSSGKSSLTSTATTVVNSMINAINRKKNQFLASGKSLLSQLITGIRSQNGSTVGAVTSVLSSASSASRNYYGTFYMSGAYVASGFVSGIRNNISAAASAAASMAAAASAAARANLKIHSPSKVFELIGSFVPKGFANGISTFGGMITRSVNRMTTTAIDVTKKTISRFDDLFNFNPDSNPTIRPVLDLSNVESGASAISGLLNKERSIDTLMNLRSIGSSIDARSQKGSNDDIISAINNLRKDLKNVGETSYNINGITYDDGSNINGAIEEIIRAVRIGRRA